MDWQDIPGFEGQYQASDTGLVRSVDRVVDTLTGPRRYPGKLLSPAANGSSEHLHVLLRGKTRYVHTLVLETFVGPRPLGAYARHLDDDPRNNRLANLAWGTPSDNAFDASRNGRNHHANKTRCKHDHPLSGANLIIDGRGRRQCAACARRRRREYDEKNPEKVAAAKRAYKQRLRAA